MKRTTIFMDEQLERELQGLARRAGRPVAALVREAVERYVVAARAERTSRLRFIAAGRSGRSDVAERHEDLLFDVRARSPAKPLRARQRQTPRRAR